MRSPAVRAIALFTLAACGGGGLGSSSADGGAEDGAARSGDGGAADASFGPARPADPPGAETYDYVIGWIRLAEARGDEAAGFDLDGHVTTRGPVGAPGCGKPDFTAPARFGGTAGVDNQLTPILGQIRELNPDVDLSADLMDSVLEGEIIVLLRLAEVGDLVDDGRVVVTLFVGRPAGGGVPATEEIEIAGETVTALAPDQAFVIDPEATYLDGDPSMPRYVFPDAYLREGRLYTAATNFSLRAPATEGREFALDFRARVSGEVSPTRMENALIGGSSTVSELLSTVASLESPAIEEAGEETVRAIIEAQADIRMDETLPTCDALSLALELRAVRAEIRTRVEAP